VFDQAVFICMTREPLYLAQSLLRARSDIHGGEDVPYGLSGPAGSASNSTDVIEDVCRQALYHERLAQEQRDRIGPRRFWIVQYETFCQDPSALVEAVAVKILGRQPPAPGDRLPPFAVSNTVRIDPQRFAALAATLQRLGHAPTNPS
jgi:hypothetical protein